ncbi:hypothetical protein A3C34_01800 [Candidatus Amesbacteria bacterium RIFCSPHIGHO2_02_FULL_48_21]|uniref:Type IV secretion system coupling protein TraD DNA-binding domain-containing protein n=3 Tax=Candidatus Amesiibacteriota TaxID=1752730 RepID=A0A1F5A0U0_9BACT|nr:MAG: hypothetical protein A2V48_03740 [Candidatus Amesbacteria bacterium RBG_19FT_COMBO_48_16]OGC95524.1 MAG: hypothetical protein A3C34_01800 [Candidatus Amesbacteria bacterium RIFCSPHIGHO2_02_FULL_48_21]OGC98748.1 MAG: hypothetical protein A2702_02185 [Candidatus Amesbacteria bacterium RIFCSPHIGHO2_01_FULL_48_75]OGD02990.1 MAG: hypothetical protein A2354_01260 [Candidatus Amesbacteria bacterium RIFOXYB1_FULL_47_12]OGD05040.1 MAG: hypothetical protein A3B58_03140 [Candidatus Amesbacteria ba
MPLTVLSLRVPRESENTPEQTAQLLASLAKAATRPGFFPNLFGHQPVYLSLEVTLVDGQIVFTIVFPPHLSTFVQSQMLATYPDVVMAPIPDYLSSWPDHPAVKLSLIRQAFASYFPLRDYADYKEVDPMLPLLGVLSKAGTDDKILIQFVLSPPARNIQKNAYSYLHPKSSLGPDGKPQKVPPPEGKKLIEDKLSQPLVGVSIRFATTKPELLHDLHGAVSVLNRPDGNSLIPSRLLPWYPRRLWRAVVSRTPFSSLTVPPATLNVMELSSLWHLPGVYTKLPNVAWSVSSSLVEAPDSLPVFKKDSVNADTNFFASTVYRNQPATFGIKLPDRLRHVYVLGKSGTGKSTLLENMAIDDFKKGRGVAFIDPHGDSSESLLNYIPSSRINDTIYFNPADRDHPIALNILEVANPDQAELVTSGIVAIFHKLYGHSWGPRLEYILRNTVLTLTQIPGTTLPDVVKMLTQSNFRNQIYPRLANPQLLSFWKDEFERLEERTRAEHIAPILNKVGQFVNSPLIHNLISHPKSSIDLEDVLNSGKILIANLSQGKLGEDNSALLGAMFITKLQLASMNRVDMPLSQRREFFLYVDEFQNFATASFIKILSEARKFGLGLVLANQYIAQIPLEIQKAIFGNVGTTVCFVMGSDDARIMEAEFGKVFSAASLVSLQKYQVAIRMTIDGTVSPPFLAATLPPAKSTNQNKAKVITVSRERYAVKLKA